MKIIRYVLGRTVLAMVIAALGMSAPLVRAQSHADAPRDPDRLWCSEHGVYEDECVLCHPELGGRLEADKHTDSHDHEQDREHRHDHGDTDSHDDHEQGREGELWCHEHELPERECGICQPQLAARLKPGEGLKVRVKDAAAVRISGVRTTRPSQEESATSVQLLGNLMYNENQLAHITPRASGVVTGVHADVGDLVEAGDPLVEIASNEIASAKQTYLIAGVEEEVLRSEYERTLQLVEKRISSDQRFQQVRADYERAQIARITARQQLQNYGLQESDIEEISKQKIASSRVILRAPFSGTLVQRHAALGERVEPGTQIFTLVDLSTMWLVLSVPEHVLGWIHTGLPVTATVPSLPGIEVRGRLSWVSSSIHEQTRVAQARAIVPNPDGMLRHNMYAEVKVSADESVPVVTVPADALQVIDDRDFVFVQLEDTLFELRHVQVVARSPKRIHIAAGLSHDEAVVTHGGFTLKSQLLISRLGAGCAEH